MKLILSFASGNESCSCINYLAIEAASKEVVDVYIVELSYKVDYLSNEIRLFDNLIHTHDFFYWNEEKKVHDFYYQLFTLDEFFDHLKPK